MLYDNFAMLTKRELLIRIVKLLKEENLVDGVKYIPVEMRPKNKRPIKCCVHKDRYILKHKIISILGFEITERVPAGNRYGGDHGRGNRPDPLV